MKMLLVAAAVLAAATPALAQQTRFYDSRGNSLGTASTSASGQTRYYDSRGNSLGTSSTSGGNDPLLQQPRQ